MIHQQVDLYDAHVAAAQTLKYGLTGDRKAWLQVVSGAARLNGLPIKAGDGVALTEQKEVVLQGHTDVNVLLFDMAF